MSNDKPLTRNWFFYVSLTFVLLLRTLIYPLAAALGRANDTNKPTHLIIGAGARGWDLIEYQEIFQSASEYCGEDSVSRLSFPSGSSTLKVFHRALTDLRPSHYFFDPRSGSQNTFTGIWEALVIGILLSHSGVTPICSLTDFPVRTWRLQCAIVSARRGVVTTLMPPRLVSHLFPHRRLLGPMPFPLSRATFELLSASRRRNRGGSEKRAVFVGSLYEPRKSVIMALRELLQADGIDLEIVGRAPGGHRVSNDEYWRVIQGADLVVSTSSQISGSHTDLEGHNHFIYKFIEATAAGSALAIEPAPDIEKFFTPDVDYISYTSADEGATKIRALWTSPSGLEEIAQRGYEKAKSIVEANYFWTTVDAELGPHPLGKTGQVNAS